MSKSTIFKKRGDFLIGPKHVYGFLLDTSTAINFSVGLHVFKSQIVLVATIGNTIFDAINAPRCDFFSRRGVY